MTAEQLVSGILEREGWPRVTELPSDRGGLTRGGVTFTNYNAWRARRGEAPLDRDAFVRITEGDARAFFTDAFIRPFEFVTDERIFELLADWSVNAGQDDPARALQAALRARGLYQGAIDGVIGPRTKAAWLALHIDVDGRDQLLFDLVSARMEFHFDRGLDADTRAFVSTHQTTQLRNLRGWMRRALSFLNPELSR